MTTQERDYLAVYAVSFLFFKVYSLALYPKPSCYGTKERLGTCGSMAESSDAPTSAMNPTIQTLHLDRTSRQAMLTDN